VYVRIYRSSESKTQPGSYRHYVERAGLKTLERLAGDEHRGTSPRHNSVERLSWKTLAEQLVTITGKFG
jgi:hypothetical protein